MKKSRYSETPPPAAPIRNFPKNSSYPKKNSPAQAPGHTVFAIPYAWLGACAGEGLAGGGLEGCASPGEANPSKVFSIEISKKLRGKQKNCGKVLDKSAGIWYDI